MAESLQITVERVLYPKPDADWLDDQFCILATDTVKSVGVMPWRPRDGERLRLGGEFGVYQGTRQFQFVSAVPDIPIDPRDQLSYICAITPGLGPSLERSIFETWGNDWIDRIAPDVVPRLTGKKFGDLIEAIHGFERERERAEAITYLMGIGATPKLSAAAWSEWGRDTIGVVRSNCYRLAELPGRSFADVDRQRTDKDGTGHTAIRHMFDIGDEDPRRLHAALLYAMDRISSGGATLVAWGELCNEFASLIGEGLRGLATATADIAIDNKTIVVVHSAGAVAAARDWQNAADIWGYIER